MSIAGAFVVPHPPLIFPEIGQGEEKRIQSTINAYRDVAEGIAVMQPDTIVIFSPHAVMYRDYFHISPGFHAAGSFARFGFPQIRLETDYDAALALEIEKVAQAAGFPAGMEGECEKELDHGTMIPLRFIQEAYKSGFKTVRIGLSGLPLQEHYHLGQIIRQAAEQLERRTVIVASGDLSHRLIDSGPYGYVREGPEYDKRITQLLAAGDLKETVDYNEEFCEKAGECGHRAMVMLAGCMKGIAMKQELLSYEGPFGVGYAVAAFQDAYVALAREALNYYLTNGRMLPLPENLPVEMLERKAGAFVSLMKRGELRGCIGTICGVRDNVACEIIENAVSAGINDPRFPQVEKSEIPEIICSVDVLSQAESITSEAKLDVKRYGVIISCGRRRGLLLPNLEGVGTVREQIDITLRKAGIEEAEYRAGKCTMERFEVVRHY